MYMATTHPIQITTTRYAEPGVMEKMMEVLSPKFQQHAKSAVDVVRICMEHVNGMDLAGRDKADLVQAILSSEELHQRLNPTVVRALDVMIENDLVQPTIDAIVAAARGKFKLKKVAACCLSFVAKYLESSA
jgi:hypothetical protein